MKSAKKATFLIQMKVDRHVKNVENFVLNALANLIALDAKKDTKKLQITNANLLTTLLFLYNLNHCLRLAILSNFLIKYRMVLISKII